MGLWRCGECGVVGLWRMASQSIVVVGCGFVEVGLLGGGALGLCCGFASDKRVEKSPDGFALDEREE